LQACVLDDEDEQEAEAEEHALALFFPQHDDDMW
jgi:hypothetical protein